MCQIHRNGNIFASAYCVLTGCVTLLVFFFKERSRLNVMNVAGALHAPPTSKSICQYTARINRTSVENVKKCSRALARLRNI